MSARRGTQGRERQEDRPEAVERQEARLEAVLGARRPVYSARSSVQRPSGRQARFVERQA